MVSCNLLHSLSVTQANGTDIDDELKRLENGAQVLEPFAQHTLGEIRIGLDRVAVRVQLGEQAPEEQSSIARDAAHCGNEIEEIAVRLKSN